MLWVVRADRGIYAQVVWSQGPLSYPLGELKLLLLYGQWTVLDSLGFREVLMQAVKDQQHGQDYTKLHKRHPGSLEELLILIFVEDKRMNLAADLIDKTTSSSPTSFRYWIIVSPIGLSPTSDLNYKGKEPMFVVLSSNTAKKSHVLQNLSSDNTFELCFLQTDD